MASQPATELPDLLADLESETFEVRELPELEMDGALACNSCICAWTTSTSGSTSTSSCA